MAVDRLHGSDFPSNRTIAAGPFRCHAQPHPSYAAVGVAETTPSDSERPGLGELALRHETAGEGLFRCLSEHVGRQARAGAVIERA